MDATLILIDSDAELLRARALINQLWNSNIAADIARLEAQARLVAAYEEKKWPRRPNPGGLAPVDLTLDGSLRPGDILATADGLVAYSGIRVGHDRTPDFTPVASFPGLTPEVRTRLSDLKVAPARAEMAANNAATSEVTSTPPPAATIAPKPVPARDKRVGAD